MTRIFCYTAILGGFPDRLHTVSESTAGDANAAKFNAFIDQRKCYPWRVSFNGWQTIQQGSEDDPRRTARKLKVLAHKTFPEAEYSLWVDGCLTPITPVWQLIDRFLSHHDICVFEHAQRSCVYKELEACIRLHKDDPAVMRKQVAAYRREGYPHDNGLAETTAVLRRHNAATEEFNEAWWAEVLCGSVRDQLSFNHVCWKLGMQYTTFEGTRVKSPHFKYRPHR